MKINLKISNLGKIQNSSIEVSNLTVFGGVNNTGKSFVSKFLYSIFKSFEINPFKVKLSLSISNLRNIILNNRLQSDRSVIKIKNKLFKQLQVLEDICNNEEHFLIYRKTDGIKKDFTTFKKVIKSIDINDIKKLDKFYTSDYKKLLIKKDPQVADSDFLLYHYNNLVNLGKLDFNEFINLAYTDELTEQLSANFLLFDLIKLANVKSKAIKVVLQDYFTVIIDKNNNVSVKTKPNTNIMNNFHMYSNIYYLDTQPNWKDEEEMFVDWRSSRSKGFANKDHIPNYVRDLIKRKRTKTNGGKNRFDKLSKNLNKVLGGEFVFSNESIYFVEKQGKMIHLDQVSFGIVQLGMLGFLIKNNIINKDTIVFLDEPETHLHPELQVVLMNVLILLVKSGVSVVMASHSIDLLKYIQIYLKKYPAFKELLSINHFSEKGVNVKKVKVIEEQLKVIQREVSLPHSELFNLILFEL